MINHIDINNLDGYANYDYYRKNINHVEMLQKQVEALAEKLNEVIDSVNMSTVS